MQPIQYIRCFFFLLFIFSLSVAHAFQSFNVPRMVAQADLVFYGEVVSVEYRNAIKEEQDELPMPYTFVTYQIKEVISGRYEDKEITLRFIGGLADAATGDILMVSHQPLFDVGDNDIILVEGNTRDECPLVQCQKGRLRLIDGMAFDDEGKKLMKTREGDIGFGSPTILKEIITHNMGGIPMEMQMSEAEAEGDSVVSTDSEITNLKRDETTKNDSNHLSATELLAIIRSYRVEDLEKRVINAEISQPFRGVDMSPVSPPVEAR